MGIFREDYLFFFCLFRSDSCYRDWVFGQLGNWTDNSSSLSHCTVVCCFTSSAGCDGISPVRAGKNSGCDDKNCTCGWSSDKDEVRKALVSLLLSIQQTLRNLTIDVSSPLGEGKDQGSICLSIATWQLIEMLPLVFFSTSSTQQVSLPLSGSRDSEDWSPFFCSVVLLHSQ